MDDGPVFLLFNRLPWELRHKIWEHALPCPIRQVLVYNSRTFPKWDPRTGTWDATDGPPRVPIPPPALLHATQESRKFALKHVSVREESHWEPSPHERRRIVRRPFDPEMDALFIHSLHFNAFLEVYMATTPWAARHLVLDLWIFRTRPHPFSGVTDSSWDKFKAAVDRVGRGLRSIALAAPGSGELRGLPADVVAKGYYRAVPDKKPTSRQNRAGVRLAGELRGRQGPDGVPRKVRVGSGRLCGVDEWEGDEDILECSQVVLKRFTASSMYQD